MLMIHPFWTAATMHNPTYLDTNHDPVKFVLTTLFHSSSLKSSEDFTPPCTNTLVASVYVVPGTSHIISIYVQQEFNIIFILYYAVMTSQPTFFLKMNFYSS